jgi:4-carboxymuconolactone decarboxylase
VPEKKSRTIADVAPKFAELSSDLLLGDVWERPGLSKRDRSLITVASHLSRHRQEYVPHHMEKALQNGVTAEELGELVTHLGFYAGWPNATPAAESLARLLDKLEERQS